MRFVRSFLLVAACMAAAVSHAALQWQGGIDQASKGAAAYITSPQGKVAGLVYGLDPVATGWKLNRQAGTLVQQPLPFQGGYSPLRPPSAYGITSSPSKAAVIDVPSKVNVPGKSSSLPVRIVEPLAKSTLANVLVKAAKVLPVVGNAYALGELLDEVGLLLQDQQYYRPANNTTSASVSDGYVWRSQIGGVFRDGLTPEAACRNVGQAASDTVYEYRYMSSSVNGVTGTCTFHLFVNGNFQSVDYRPLTRLSSSSCQAGYYVVNNVCYPVNPSAPTPVSDDEASLELQSVPDERLIDAFNQLPNESSVIDVIAREIQDDPQDHEFRWPSALQIPSSTIQVGDPVTTTTTNPDGSTVTTTTTTTATTNGNRIDFVTKTETTTRDPQGNQTSTTTVTTNPAQPNNPNNPQQEDLECGLPGTPPCKIDETGTPSPPEDDGENTFKGLIPNCLKQNWRSCFPELPDINWSFSLPSGCGPIPVPFGKYGFSEVNICPWQGMIHDIMSMLWAAAGLFGAIGILSGRRNSEA